MSHDQPEPSPACPQPGREPALRREVRYAVRADLQGTCLIELLVTRFAYHDRGGWLVQLAAGRVTRNGAPAAAADVLAAGDVVAYDVRDLPEPPVDWRVGIVYEDDDLLVVDKPGNLPSHPAGRYFNHTLWAWLKTRHGLADPQLVNRLDRETSGLVLVAKTPSAGRACAAQFRRRSVRKRYTVFVEGPFPDTLHAAGWLADDGESPVAAKRRFFAGASEAPSDAAAESATTHFRRVATCGAVSRVEAEPLTGRRHQIRATLHSLGHPVVGDKVYGLDPTAFLRFREGRLTASDRVWLRLDRQALHADLLELQHPVDGRALAFACPLPEVLDELPAHSPL